MAVCDCTTPEIWFKMLQLFKKAELIHCVDNINLPDPKFVIGVMLVNVYVNDEMMNNYLLLMI